jgi:hypothetical protein
MVQLAAAAALLDDAESIAADAGMVKVKSDLA